ncbi:YcxB family protein [Roseburia sp. 499]|uniref:YcxB family protein n=1 Tax=Roseburia sp. 499 TaxID=1261634 RepID=UPI00095208DC|nr:YcxB family protein [Roseburia sp. 499]WVK69236.1 YcxB family protein [Roseburia sp. 499]
MTAEFDVSITSKDMYRFNMYHAYHGFQGIFATVIGILVLVVAGATFGKIDTMYTVLYAVFGMVFLVYVPVSLYMRSKQQILSSEVLRQALHYKVDEEGVHVSQNDQTADLLWNQIYKVVSTKSNLLIYSSRVNAYVIPRATIGADYETVAKLAEKHLEKYRLKLR